MASICKITNLYVSLASGNIQIHRIADLLYIYLE
jgi:hypothetical protein